MTCLFVFAHIAMYLPAPHIERAIEERHGTEWCNRYSDTLKSMVIDDPLPMTPENKGTYQVLHPSDVLKATTKR